MQELKCVSTHPEMVTKNAMAVAQFLWTPKTLVEYSIANYVLVGDKDPPNNGKVGGRIPRKTGISSQRPEIDEPQKRLFACMFSNNSFLPYCFLIL